MSVLTQAMMDHFSWCFYERDTTCRNATYSTAVVSTPQTTCQTCFVTSVLPCPDVSAWELLFFTGYVQSYVTLPKDNQLRPPFKTEQFTVDVLGLIEMGYIQTSHPRNHAFPASTKPWIHGISTCLTHPPIIHPFPCVISLDWCTQKSTRHCDTIILSFNRKVCLHSLHSKDKSGLVICLIILYPMASPNLQYYIYIYIYTYTPTALYIQSYAHLKRSVQSVCIYHNFSFVLNILYIQYKSPFLGLHHVYKVVPSSYVCWFIIPIN